MNPSSSTSNSHNKNIIGVNCTISGNSTVGDNSGNSKSNNNHGGDNENVIPDRKKLQNSLVGGNSGNSGNTDIQTIVGDNQENNTNDQRTFPKCKCKNRIVDRNCFCKAYIVGDNSGNIRNGGGGGNVNNSRPKVFNDKNVIKEKTEIGGNSIVGDNSGNKGKIDDSPNLLQASFNRKNAIEAETKIGGKSIIGDGSGNNELPPKKTTTRKGSDSNSTNNVDGTTKVGEKTPPGR